jgi:quaternary ammonium compound-resistance protein SugE
MAWLYVICAAVVDITFFTLLKKYGLARPGWAALILTMGLAIPFIMQYALKTLPLGTAYACFVGLATVGATLAGIFLFQESVSWPRLAFIGLIIAGVIGLRLLESQAG